MNTTENCIPYQRSPGILKPITSYETIRISAPTRAKSQPNLYKQGARRVSFSQNLPDATSQSYSNNIFGDDNDGARFSNTRLCDRNTRSSLPSLFRRRRSVGAEKVSSSLRRESVENAIAEFSGSEDDVNDEPFCAAENLALSFAPQYYEGHNLRNYRPVSPQTLDEIMFVEGTQGRQAKQRQTAPDVFAESVQQRRRSRLSSDSDYSQSGSGLESARLSATSDTLQAALKSFRRNSQSSRSSSISEKTNGRRQTSNITRKFITSLTQVAKRDSVDAGRESRRSLGSFSALGRSLGVRMMLKREQMLGGQRMAVLGTLLAARKKFGLNDHLVIQFDATIPWRKLRLWVRIRSMLGRLHQEVVDRVVNDPSSPFYMQLHEEDDSMGIDRNHYMFFDPSDFKANRQMRTSHEVRRILTLPPEQRTEEDIHCAMIGLRGISAIAEYPVRMQRYLAEYGTFQCYNAKRAIVRQGRPPEVFYYILYGRVLVAVREEITGRVELKCYLHRGHSFGELAIIKNTERQSSVITKNYTELLCLSSDIFQKYFMIGGVKNLNDPDQNNFVRSLSFLKGWPLELILEKDHHQNVTFGYFKRGLTLVKDSNYSDWLIIVKSGSLDVLKKLVKVRPTVSKKTGLPRIEGRSNSSYVSFLENGQEYVRYLEQNNIILPVPLGSCEHNEKDENNADDSIDDESDFSDDVLRKVRHVNRPHTTAVSNRSSVQSSRSIWSATGKSGSTSNIVEFKSDTLLLKVNKAEEKKKQAPKVKRDRSFSRDLSNEDDVLELEDKRTFLDDLDSAYNARAHVRTEADLNPQFVFVQTLTKGDVFGLAQCLFCDQPSMSVVSNGADCLLLNKKLYLDNCSPELIRRLRVEISPYPSDEKLQDDLVTCINWDIYKDALRKQIYAQHKRRAKVS